MKKFFAAAFLIFALFAALCPAAFAETYRLEAADADLSEAPYVILEPDEPPFNLGGWHGENTVRFTVEVEEAGDYAVFLVYSKQAYDGDKANLKISFENEETGSPASVSAPLPVTGKDWSNYREYKFGGAVSLESGSATVRLESEEPRRGRYAMNLRAIILTDDEDYIAEHASGDEEDGDEKTETRPEEYATYTNARFGYSVEYPAFLSEGTELDGGRGMEFKSPDWEYSVEIWGEWNVKDIFGNFADGKKLLSDREFKLKGISEIVPDSKNSGGGFYSLDWYSINFANRNAGYEGAECIYHERGIVDDRSSVIYVLEYPKLEEERAAAIVARMDASLKLKEKKESSPEELKDLRARTDVKFSPDGDYFLLAEGNSENPGVTWTLCDSKWMDRREEFTAIGNAEWVSNGRFVLTRVDGVRYGEDFYSFEYGLQLSVVLYDVSARRAFVLKEATGHESYLFKSVERERIRINNDDDDDGWETYLAVTELLAADWGYEGKERKIKVAIPAMLVW
jgi:hypothetical protein